MRRPGVHSRSMKHFGPCCNSLATASGLPLLSGTGWFATRRGNRVPPAFDARKTPIPPTGNTPPHLPPTFNRLAWSNLAAQSAEQIALAAAPIVAVLLLGVGEGQTGML